MNTALESKVQELVDRQEIWSLLLRYARGLDRMDRAMIRACYWDNAIDDHYGFVGTPDAFIDWTFEYNRKATTVQHHGISNHVCEIVGNDAYSETYYTYIGANVELPHLLSMGRYIDHFERRDGIWKIANRATIIEKNFALQEFPTDAEILAGDTRCGPLLPASRDRADLSYLRPVVPRRPPDE